MMTSTRIFLFTAMVATPILAAVAQAANPDMQPAPRPKELGRFRDWIAADYVVKGQRVCYAFTVANDS